MALIATLAALGAAGLFCLLIILAGHRFIRWCALDFGNDTEHLLYCAALGVVLFETAVFFLEAAGALRAGIPLLLVALAAAGIWELPQVYRRLTLLARKILSGTRGQQLLFAAILAVLLFEGIAAMAPLTGSDAMHYHFAAPLQVLQEGWHANFFLAHSFFTGQGHLMILTGLALGSEKLALGLLFLGGALSAAATACLAKKWVPRAWALLAALLFLLTPVVFWQITSAGAPDLWMAFFAAMGVLVIARCRPEERPVLALLAGVISGGVAGTKYTGCIIAASMALAFVWQTRSLRRLAVFFGGALSAGIWPFARNALWTGDPVFPFLLGRLAPERVNAFALAGIRADTGAAAAKGFWQLVKFPFFADVDTAHLGFWQFMGPVCVMFAPLILLAARNTPLWRTTFIVWLASSIGIGASAGMTRFLMPVLPLAMAAAIAGVAALSEKEWRFARGLSIASIAGFLLMGAGGLLMYGRSAAAAAAGFTSRESYLLQRAPDYPKAEFVNKSLAGKGGAGRALVFFRHVYYVRVPFVYGDPAASWAVDPDRLKTAKSWEAFFRGENIRWVVRASDYPSEIAGPLLQLEASGKLVPIAQTAVTDFSGNRFWGVRDTSPVVILQVKDLN